MRCAIGLLSIKTTKDIGTHMRNLNIFGRKTEISSHAFVNFFTFSFTLPHLNASNSLIFSGNYQDSIRFFSFFRLPFAVHTTKYFLLAFPDAPLSCFQFLPRVASSLLTRGYSDLTPSGYCICNRPFSFSHFLPFAHSPRHPFIFPVTSSPFLPFTPS